MSMNVMGADMDANVREWEPGQRRVGVLLAAGLALILLIAGIVTWVFAGDALSILYWVFVGLVALVLVFVLLVLVLGARPRAVAQAEPHIGPAGPASAVEPIVDAMPEPAAPEPPRAKAITLRCGDCGTVFDVTDTGERPLYHTCPGCGAEGVLKGPAAPEPPTPAPEPTFVAPEPAPAPPPAPVHEAPVPSPPAAPRKLKLRCGGCKEVFVIDDSGERPLRRSCPHCGRLGEIR